MPYGMSTRHYRGDPFLHGLIKKGIGAAFGIAKSALGIPSTPKVQPIPASLPTYPVMPGGTPMGQYVVQKTPGVKGAIQRVLPGGETGYQVVGRKRRRINPANPKALRRAIRRQQGFVKLARRALKGTGYTIVSRGSRRPKRDMPSGHTHVR